MKAMYSNSLSLPRASKPVLQPTPIRRHTTLVVASSKSNETVNKGLSVLEWTGKLVPQGLLVKGVKESWRFAWTTLVRELAPQSKDGSYKRPQYTFSGKIGTPAFPVGGSATFGPVQHWVSGQWLEVVGSGASYLSDRWLVTSACVSSLQAESGRYHVYVGNACPWCHRVLLVLAVRGLSKHVSWTQLTADPTKARRGGWVFDPRKPDPVWGAADLW